MDSSDSFRSTAAPFVFSLIAQASDGFNSDLRVIFPRHRLRKVSRGHSTSFPFMPTLITTHIPSFLFHATPQVHWAECFLADFPVLLAGRRCGRPPRVHLGFGLKLRLAPFGFCLATDTLRLATRLGLRSVVTGL